MRNSQSLLIMLRLLTGLHDLWARSDDLGERDSRRRWFSLACVSVVLKNRCVGTQTDGTGSYTLTVPATGGSLANISFIGPESREFVIGSQNIDWWHWLLMHNSWTEVVMLLLVVWPYKGVKWALQANHKGGRNYQGKASNPCGWFIW